MAWRGREGVVYVCGEWEHGQLGLPLERSFGDPTSIDPPPTPYQTPVPSTGVRINDKGEEVYPLPAIDSNEAVSHPGAFEELLRDHFRVPAALAASFLARRRGMLCMTELCARATVGSHRAIAAQPPSGHGRRGWRPHFGGNKCGPGLCLRAQ